MNRRRVAGAMIALALLVVAVAPLAAHPPGTTAVSIVLRHDGAIDVRLTAEAEPLIAKLEAFAMRPASSGETAAARTQRLVALRDTLVAHAEARLGAVVLPLVWRDATISEAGVASVRLTARAAAQAGALVWRTTLIFGSYPLGVSREDGAEAVVWLNGSAPSAPIVLEDLGASTHLLDVVWIGFTHILPKGLDHILFVVGLYLLSSGWRQVLLQISAFTLAHSITLGLGLFGVVSLPSDLVEPLIALSVAYVGVENLLTSRLRTWRVGVVFGFGLLHGLGFADALASLQLTRADLLATLVSFNAGVELGQLTVIGLAAVALRQVEVGSRKKGRALFYVFRKKAPDPFFALRQLASAAIGLTGLLWTIERII